MSWILLTEGKAIHMEDHVHITSDHEFISIRSILADPMAFGLRLAGEDRERIERYLYENFYRHETLSTPLFTPQTDFATWLKMWRGEKLSRWIEDKKEADAQKSISEATP